MKKILFIIVIALTMLGMGSKAQAQQTLAFPGADGYGKYATGGRGGEVCYVTRLDDCADNKLVEGTLRWALRHDNGGKPRTILFKVSGTIYLTSKLRFQYGDVSILGQSAPGGGITLAGYNMYISKNNVIVRYIRFRAGDVPNQSMTGLDMENCKNVILDHCSMTWSMEECLTAYDTDNTTVQWCIIGEGLYSSKNAKGDRAYATQWGGEHSTMHHTLITNSHSRSPRFNGARNAGESGHDTKVDSEFANNVVFNWSSTGAIYGGEMKQGAEGYDRVYMINNYYRPGPSTKTGKAATHFASPSSPYGQWYLSGNMFEESGTYAPWTAAQAQAANADNSKCANNLPQSYLMSELPYTLSGMQYATAEEAYADVVSKAGASLPRYDEVDRRLLDEAAGKAAPQYYASCGKGHAGIIDSPDDITLTTHDIYCANGIIYANYPFLGMLQGDKYAVDTDGDGMPDAYEDAKGLNKSDAADGAALCDDGYTNLEKYLNGIADGNISKADYETSDTPDIKGTQQTLPATADGKTYSGYIIGGIYYAANTTQLVAEGAEMQPVVTVSYDVEGISPMSFVAGKAVKMPVAEKSGYDFKGWTDGTTTYEGGKQYAFDTCTALKAVFAKQTGPVEAKIYETNFQDWEAAKSSTTPASQTFTTTYSNEQLTFTYAEVTVNPSGTHEKFTSACVTEGFAMADKSATPYIETSPLKSITTITMVHAATGSNRGWGVQAKGDGDSDWVTVSSAIANPASGQEITVKVNRTNCQLRFYNLTSNQNAYMLSLVISGMVDTGDVPMYKVNATASPANGGTITRTPSDAELPTDTKVTFTAKASADYFFINWTDADGKEVTRNQTFSHVVTADASFTANFRSIDSYTDVFKEGSPYNAECRDAQELQIALKAAAKSSADCYRIFLHDGLYDLGNTCLTAVPKNVSLIGESQDGTVIANTPEAEGIGVTATLKINSGVTGVYMQDLTLLNRYDYGTKPTSTGRAVCLQDQGNRNAYKNVTLLSNQDTYYANKGSQHAYWETSKITGTVDFICGDGAVYFNECELYVNARNNGNVICAPNTQAGSLYWGFVFNNCTIDGDAATQANNYHIGRPWNDSPHCTYINTTFKLMPKAEGWTNMTAGLVCRLHEYGSKDKDGNPIDLSARNINACGAAAGSDACVVDETFAAKYTVDAVCGSEWNPQSLTRQIAAPDVTADGATMQWTAAEGAYCYAIVRNGKVIDFTTATSYPVDAANNSYAIRVANQRGGLGPKSNVIGTDGIADITIDTDASADTALYNISGQRICTPQRGQVYIQNRVKRVAK